MRVLMFVSLFSALALQVGAETPAAAPAPLPPRPPLDAFGRLPAVDDVAISPSGTHIALIVRRSDISLVYDYDIATQKSAIVNLGKIKVRGISWADDQRVLITSSQTASLEEFLAWRDEYWQVTILDVAKNKGATLFHDDYGYRPIVYGPVHRVLINGERKLLAGSIDLRQAGDYNLLEFSTDPAIKRGHIAALGSPETQTWVVSPQGDIVARADYDAFHKIWRLKYNVPKQGWRTLYELKVGLETPTLYGLGRDGQSVVVYGPGKDPAKETAWNYHEISPTGDFSEALQPKGHDVEPLFHPQTGRLAGFGRDSQDEDYELSYFDPHLKHIYDLTQKAAPGGRSYIKGFAEDPRKLALYVEGPGNPGGYYFVDYDKHRFIEVGPKYPEIPPEWVAEQRPVTYKAADGLEIHGFLTLPPGREAKDLPLIVFPHGGPWGVHDGVGFDWWAQAMASRGYAVLQPNYRGSSGYGAAFETVSKGEFGKKMQTDLSDGVRDLAKQGLINPKRVCIVGASYGGYAALAGAALDPGVYACAASVAGVADVKSFMSWLEENRSRESLGFQFWKDRLGPKSGWDAVSPYRQVKNITIPVLLVHGVDDTVVPEVQSKMMRDALEREGKTVDFVELKDEDHWLSTDARRTQMLNAVVAFVEKYNPPSP